MPVGERLRRFADQYHFEHARHDRHQPVAALLSRSATANGPFLQRQSVQDAVHIIGHLVGFGRDFRSRATSQRRSTSSTTSASSSVNVCSTNAISSSQIGGPIKQWAGQSLGRCQVKRGDTWIVRQTLAVNRLGPWYFRANEALLDVYYLPRTMCSRHAWRPNSNADVRNVYVSGVPRAADEIRLPWIRNLSCDVLYCCRRTESAKASLVTPLSLPPHCHPCPRIHGRNRFVKRTFKHAAGCSVMHGYGPRRPTTKWDTLAAAHCSRDVSLR